MAKVVAVANNKGGVAKTTTVLALSQAWSMQGLRVLAVDLDSQGNLTTLMAPEGMEDYGRTIREALNDKKDLPYIKVAENLYLTPATLSLSNIENEMVAFFSREQIFKKLLDEVSDEFDIIIVDCPPALGLMTFSALFAADALVMPVMADSLSFAGMTMVAELANRVKEYNPNLVLKGVIVTKFKADKISNHYLDVIKTNSRTAYIETVVHEATKIKQATALHANIYEYDPNGRASQEYKEVAEELLSRILG